MHTLYDIVGSNSRAVRMSVGKIFLSAASGIALSECGSICSMSDLQYAALYLSSREGYGLPTDTWTRNIRLEAYLSKAMALGGVVRLRAEGLQCSPRPSSDACADCYICGGVLPQGQSDVVVLT